MESFEDIRRELLSGYEEYSRSDDIDYLEDDREILPDGALRYRGLNSLLDYHTDVLLINFNESLDSLMCVPDNPGPITDRLRDFFLSQTKLFILSGYIAEYEGGSKEKSSIDALNQLAKESYDKYASLPDV